MNKKAQLVIVISLIPFAIYFWPAALGGDTTIMMVQGQSMLPTILPGSLVVAKAAPEYNVGDIVAYTQRDGGASKIIVHRIIEETDDGFIIKGDNNPKEDVGAPTEDDILGTVLFSTPYVGDVIGIFKNPVILIFAAVITMIIQMKQKKRKEKREKVRCARLGIPYIPPKMRNPSKKAKKPDYSLFFAAILLNVVAFVLTQISIENGTRPEGDMLTGFLYKAIVPGLASTLIFAFYFAIIFGLYHLAKSSEKKHTNRLISYESTHNYQKLTQAKKSTAMLSVASLGWLLFIIMTLFNVISMTTQ